MTLSNEFTIRPLRSDDDYAACLELQRLTWGDDPRDLVQPVILAITQKVGGVAAGAFDRDERLVGFVYGISGVREGRPAHWSHMLAVLPDLQGMGIGRRLKQYQQQRLLESGVEWMYWTFDPLLARNAHLNLTRLGAQVVEYVEDMYGDRGSSKTDSVIGTDRLVVAWHLTGNAPPAAAKPPPAPEAVVDLSTTSLPEVDPVWIEVPNDIQVLKVEDPDLARRWRAATRATFHHYLGNDYIVAGFERRSEGGGRYWLTRR